jgi:glutathione peroxidase
MAMNKIAKAVDREHGDKAYIKWNFTKFLVDREGNIVARFEPTADMAEVKAKVEEVL